MNEPGTRSHAPHEPGAVVPCELRQGNLIATARCVEYQVANGCHCRYALDSIKRVEQLLEEQSGEGFDDDLDLQAHKQELVQLRARAEEIEKHRPPPAPPAKEKPMAKEPRICSHPGCGKTLRGRGKGYCVDQEKHDRNGGGRAVSPEAPPAGVDVVQVLQQQLEHHRGQAARIEKALEALS